MANKVRGFHTIALGDESFDVSLHLNALAELESEFGVESFEEVLDFGAKISASKLKRFMLALLRGNGVDMTPERVAAIGRITPAGFMEMLTGLMNASGMTNDAPAGGAAAGGAPLGDASAGSRG